MNVTQIMVDVHMSALTHQDHIFVIVKLATNSQETARTVQTSMNAVMNQHNVHNCVTTQKAVLSASAGQGIPWVLIAKHALMSMSVKWGCQIAHNYAAIQLEATAAVVRTDTIFNLIGINAKVTYRRYCNFGTVYNYTVQRTIVFVF